MWFASTALQINILRVSLILLLALVTLINISIHPFLRALVGTVSLGLLWWTIKTTFNDTLNLLDILSLLLAGVSLLILALEKGKQENLEEIPAAHSSRRHLAFEAISKMQPLRHHHLT